MKSAGSTSRRPRPSVGVRRSGRAGHGRDDAVDRDGDVGVQRRAAGVADAARQQARHRGASRVDREQSARVFHSRLPWPFGDLQRVHTLADQVAARGGRAAPARALAKQRHLSGDRGIAKPSEHVGLDRRAQPGAAVTDVLLRDVRAAASRVPIRRPRERDLQQLRDRRHHVDALHVAVVDAPLALMRRLDQQRHRHDVGQVLPVQALEVDIQAGSSPRGRW